MKRVAFLTVFISVFAFCNAQNHYYWSGGKKIWLDTDSSKMIVEFDNEQDIRAFTSVVTETRKLPDKGLTLVSLPAKSDAVIQKIKADKTAQNKTYACLFHKTNVPFYLTGDILMKPKKGISAKEIMSKFNIDGQVVKEKPTGIVVVRVSNWDDVMNIANAIYESNMVEWCHPDFITKIERTTTDPLFLQQYYLKNTGQNGGVSGIDIKAEQAWNITLSNSNIRVAVIDDGVEAHEDLGNRVLQGFTPLNPTGFGAPTT